jgi:uncharacterized membrane protein YraQ (UPF0718 family)
MMKWYEKWRAWPGAYRFLSVVTAVYAVVGVVYPDKIEAAAVASIMGLLKLFPIIVVVYLLMQAVTRYVKPERIKKHLGHESGYRGWLYTVLGGVIISGPPLVMYPLLADLKQHGLSERLMAVFLYTNNVKIAFLPVMAYYFGLRYTVVLTLLIIIFSIPNGYIVQRLMGSDKLLDISNKY